MTVKLTDISPSGTTADMRTSWASALLVCDRCHKLEEIVVAVMQIEPLEQRWALCGPCKQQLPPGFHLA